MADKRKIFVTEEDIKLGVAKQGDNCAIARACKRQLGFATVYVDEDSVALGSSWESVRLPQIAQDFIRRYDADFLGERELAVPFEFEIDLDERNYGED